MQEHLDEVNERLRQKGMREIDPRYAQKLWIEDLLRDVVYLPFEQPNGIADEATSGLPPVRRTL